MLLNNYYNIVYSLPNFTSLLVTGAPLHDKNTKFTALAFVGLPKS